MSVNIMVTVASEASKDSLSSLETASVVLGEIAWTTIPTEFFRPGVTETPLRLSSATRTPPSLPSSRSWFTVSSGVLRNLATFLTLKRRCNIPSALKGICSLCAKNPEFPLLPSKCSAAYSER